MLQKIVYFLLNDHSKKRDHHCANWDMIRQCIAKSFLTAVVCKIGGIFARPGYSGGDVLVF